MPGIITKGFRTPPSHPNTRLGKWTRGWLFGQQGLSGAGSQFVHSIDPRTPQGALGLAGMLVPGKASGENALAAHLGHSDFRPYHAHEGLNYEGLLQSPDQVMRGGSMFHGGDIGYSNEGGNSAMFPGQHGYSIHELLGLLPSSRIKMLNRKQDAIGLLQKPYVTKKGLYG